MLDKEIKTTQNIDRETRPGRGDEREKGGKGGTKITQEICAKKKLLLIVGRRAVPRVPSQKKNETRGHSHGLHFGGGGGSQGLKRSIQVLEDMTKKRGDCLPANRNLHHKNRDAIGLGMPSWQRFARRKKGPPSARKWTRGGRGLSRLEKKWFLDSRLLRRQDRAGAQ